MSSAPPPNASRLMLARFRKGQRTVPGTYMSAAGIQTELTPSCLHKVAVHEAMYRRHVNMYRQDLEQQVDKLNKRQNVLKKSMQYYRHKKRENRRNRFQPSMTSASDTSMDVSHSKQLLIIVSEDGRVSKPRRIKRSGSNNTRQEVLTSDSLVSDSGIVLEFEKNNEDVTCPDEDITAVCQDLEQSFVLEDDCEAAKLPDETPASTGNLPQKSKTVKAKPRKTGLIHIRNQTTLNADVHAHGQSLNDIDVSSDTGSRETARKSKSAAANSKPESLSAAKRAAVSEVELENRKILDSWPMTQSKTRSRSRAADSTQTSAFMQLVRMKQNKSMTRHMNVIDRLISGSKNKRLVYLRRISEVSDTGLVQLRDDHQQLQTAADDAHTDAPFDDVDGEVRPASRHVTLPAIEPEPLNENVIGERFKKAFGKIPTMPRELEPDATLDHVDARPERRDATTRHKLKPTRNHSLPSERITSSKDITNFIQNEREIVSLYGKNVTWQESLAKLKDVHSVFPSKLLETNEYTA